MAWTFIGVSQDAGILIPEEMAVIAAGNDEIICEACDVPLAGVDANSQRVGHEAAALLDGLLAGNPAPSEPLRVPPRGVIVRRSADVLAIADPRIAEVKRLIHEHACRPLTVPEILRAIPVNRRWLERRFKETLGRTLQSEIMRTRIAHARRLLVDSDLKLDRVARQCGFAQAHHFGAMFRREMGTTPAVWRRAMRSI